MLLLYDNPELVRAVVDRVGQTIYEAFRVFCQMEQVFAIWLGDDMGFKTATPAPAATPPAIHPALAQALRRAGPPDGAAIPVA